MKYCTIINDYNQLDFNMVRVKGLEPPRLAAPEPKSGASTNSATPAIKSISQISRLLA